MTPDLITDLIRDEGCKLMAYPDPKTHGAPWTVGYGHAGREVHPGLCWTIDQARATLEADVRAVAAGLDTAIPWWRQLDDVRQDVLANMAFNMGVHRLMGFIVTLARVRLGDYPAAAEAMLDSEWAKDPPAGVGERAKRLAAMMSTGKPWAVLADESETI